MKPAKKQNQKKNEKWKMNTIKWNKKKLKKEKTQMWKRKNLLKWKLCIPMFQLLHKQVRGKYQAWSLKQTWTRQTCNK